VGRSEEAERAEAGQQRDGEQHGDTGETSETRGEGRAIDDPSTHTGPPYTLADVKASYTEEKAWAEMQGDLPCYLIYRPISFHLTPPLLRLGVPVSSENDAKLAIR